MKSKIENWLLNVLAGKLVARGAVTIVAYVASAPVQAMLAKAGLSIQIDQAELAAGMIAAAHAAFEWFKARRMKNPTSPAVQTDKAIDTPAIPS